MNNKPKLVGWFTGVGGGYGADIRLELNFSEFKNNEGYIDIWVWSSITEDFVIKKCKFSINNEETPELSFDSTIAEELKDRVVTNFIAKWDKENDKIYLTLTIQLSEWVPSFDIEAECIGIDKQLGGLYFEEEAEPRKRPY